ncbi:hypothetical protein AVEN_77780-1 [Araneus ventricosus]|uniref:Uncharacterized protein n=1 Tax=Araneus ventricosus TaxID=182803 RepID=A0A4Y2RVH9_ARAVE|nr:hypothetical protein AVEN_77780-1 [Araneus ventricosus]
MQLKQLLRFPKSKFITLEPRLTEVVGTGPPSVNRKFRKKRALKNGRQETTKILTLDFKHVHMYKILNIMFSNLKSEINSAALSIWQDNWDDGETGRSTHDIVPRVSNKLVGWN